MVYQIPQSVIGWTDHKESKMVAIPKADLMKRKYIERREAGLSELKLYVNDKIRQDVIDYYHELCDRFDIPEDLRPRRK